MSATARRDIEKEVYQILDTADPSGYNHRHYQQNVFGKMDEKGFAHWVEQIRNKKERIYILTPPLKVSLRPKNILTAAKLLGLELFERIRIMDTTTGRSYMTPEKYLIIQVPIRRLKQYLMDKMSVPESDRRVNPTTGQVAKPDKGSSMSKTQGQTLDSKGLVRCLTELTNVRGGNVAAYASIKSAIEETGVGRMDDIDMSDGIRSAQSTQATFESMHLENNLSGG